MAVDQDEREADDDNEPSETSEELASASSSDSEPSTSEDDVDESAPVAPRNREERRSLAKKVTRGQATPEGEIKERDRNKAIVRPKLPPLTTTGKSTANTDEVPPWVKRTGDWLADRRSTVFGVVAAIVLAGVGGTYAMDRRIEKRAEQAAKTVQAAEISNAEVRGADAPADPPNAPPRRIRAYASHTERARAALAASEQAIGTGDMQISPVSKLMRAQALYDLGRYAEAKTILEPLVGADVMGLEGRVLETLGFCQEALGDNRSALARFEELGRLEGDGWRDLAGYHQARVLRRMNENDRARDGLRRLIERLDRARPDDLAAVQSRSVQEQAKLLLHEIAPDDPLGRTQAPTDTDSILRMLQQQMGGQMQVRRPGQPAQP